MFDFIREAGFGIYPVLAFGIAAVVVAAKQLVERDPRRVVTVLWLMALTGMAGVLGTATGVQMSARHVGDIPEKWIFLIGLAESLHNLTTAAVLVMLAMLVMLTAHVRGRGEPAGAGPRETARAH